MRIGYCSPFNPMRSGISDFSEELIMALRDYMEVVVFTPLKPSLDAVCDNFEVHLLSELDNGELRRGLDLIIYHVGNNVQYHGEIVDILRKYPGIVEFHDFGLHHLSAAQTLEQKGKDAYLKLVKYCHGTRGVRIAEQFFAGLCGAPWNDHALDMCMNKHIIDSARAVIVHAESTKQMVLGILPDMPIKNILLHSEQIRNPYDWEVQCRKSLNISKERYVFGSFGFATEAKRIKPILEALSLFRKNKRSDFTYLIVGEAQKELHLTEQIAKLNLTDNVLITGFVELEEFKNYMGACDFCLNLRYPTQGESSASLHRTLGMGKPVIVTNIGTFEDYPDEFALKVRYDHNEVEDIYNAICEMVSDREKLKTRGEAALRFAQENCDLKKNARAYAEFFQSLIDHTWQPDYIDTLVGRLVELGLTDYGYLAHLEECIII